MKNNKLIIILGPTASGKSNMAVKLAKKFDGEIISADSRQIYKEMDIGTAKITKEEMSGIPHYMIDIVKPDNNFTLAQFQKKTIKIIKDIQNRNKLPFLVGGTGLYIQSVVDNLKIPKTKPNKKLRNELEELTNQELINKLKKIDPKALEIIDIKNKRRLIRALEICLLTKELFSEQRKKNKPIFETLQIGIKLNTKNLEQRITRRIEEMIKDGLIKENEKLLKKYGNKPYSMSGIGYQEVILYLKNKITLKQAKELIKIHTRQYAKRQITWFKRDEKIKWVKNYSKAKKIIKEFIKKDTP